MAKKSASITRILLFAAAVVAVISLYCIDIVSTAVYANESILAVNAALQKDSANTMSEPEIAPLLDILRRDKSDFAAQSVHSLIDLKSITTESKIKEFHDRLQSSKAKMTFGVRETILDRWRTIAQEALEAKSDDTKKQAITTLRQEVNKAIVSALVPRPAESTLNQYLLIKNFIPALPELTELFSNKELSPD